MTRCLDETAAPNGRAFRFVIDATPTVEAILKFLTVGKQGQRSEFVRQAILEKWEREKEDITRATRKECEKREVEALKQSINLSASLKKPRPPRRKA